MDADRVIAIATDPSTASVFDVGRLAARVLHLEQGIVASAGWWDAMRPDALAFEVVDDFRRLLDRCRHDSETAAGGGWMCDHCGEATDASSS